jgi:hypothetical protein
MNDDSEKIIPRIDDFFYPKAVANFLDGKHHFYIPSYQRGYRWDRKQVEDLLKDISDFSSSPVDNFYCLQPVVVRPNDQVRKDEIVWEVIDGQQRLTTILLLLKYLREKSSDKDMLPAELFKISYETRRIDFDNIHPDKDIDSYHIFHAQQTIHNWFSKSKVRRSKIEEVLFLASDNGGQSSNYPQVKFLWYVADTEKAVDAIRIFNNLNKGKIKLTSAELIKALFVLKSIESKSNVSLELAEFAFEWNQIESTLHDDRIWFFLSNVNYQPATRIDIVFDFLTEKGPQHDFDFPYRKFQALFDGQDEALWNNLKVTNFGQAWQRAKEVYNTFMHWYEDNALYHYIGYLIYCGIPLREIFTACQGKAKSDVRNQVLLLIKNTALKDIKTPSDINELTYDDDRVMCKKVLLLFNIESYLKHEKKLNTQSIGVYDNEVGYYRFPFDLFKLNDWDIEHVDSRTENPLKDVNAKLVWLAFVDNIESHDADWPNLKGEAIHLKKDLEKKNADEGNRFEGLYRRILKLMQDDRGADGQNVSKETIGNLTLLDAGTNRGYGNALFPSKRQAIIEKDKEGVFIPICTKNLFLKYYTKRGEYATQWKNRWTADDSEEYLKQIHETIDYIIDL